MVISPKVKKKLFWLFFSLYIANRKRWEEIKLQKSLLLSRFFLYSYCSSSSSFYFARNFCSSLLLLLLRFVSWVLHLFLMLSLNDCWWGLFQTIRNALLSWIHVYVLWNIKGWSCLRVFMKEMRSAENRTPRVCMSSEFFGFNTDVFAFLWYF